MKKISKKSCSLYKPVSELPFSQNYNVPSCSHCVYFSTRNCHASAVDNIEYENELL